ncbi:phosphotransferase [Nonomuraea sp. LPB2021202275-12-8]|uniref:phosphotransferase n=1 Tax=Nonomuraea sp. LPB2021202275-12-8 TaxID=3120159 RepID=UPI00300C834E
MQIGELLGTGRTADVFAVDGHRVLRRYRAGRDAGREGAVMAHLAAGGFPVPRIFPGASQPTDLVMERLSGPTMLAALLEGTMAPARAGRILAELLHRLHAVAPPPSARPGDRILHLDLHPDNVLLTPRGPVVIDWCNTEEGEPELDWAMSALILAQAAVTGLAGQEAVRPLLASLLAAGPSLGGHLPRARARRAADPHMSPQESAALDGAVRLIGTIR